MFGLAAFGVVGLIGVIVAVDASKKAGVANSAAGSNLIFAEDWSKGIDFSLWKHEITVLNFVVVRVFLIL